jgi:hypothetical protein
MSASVVSVRFSRSGEIEGVPLSKTTAYQISVGDGPREAFRSPWDESELEGLIADLRNEGDTRAGLVLLDRLGRELSDALKPSTAITTAIRKDTPATIHWQLDYPELAAIPWEIASWWLEPRRHILLDDDFALVRSVPLFDPGQDVRWPTGKHRSLRLLFAWAERRGMDVPHLEHHEALVAACEANGVDFSVHEIATASALAEVVVDLQPDLVHILAHGAKAVDGAWGLQLSDEVVTGEQVARALRAGDSAPAFCTVAACDSAGESTNSFSSVAYRLHAHGVPMVLASQFRLRKRVSNLSVARVYEGLLAGEHPLAVLAGLRQMLSTEDTEAWANEVLYSTYPDAELDAGVRHARQQAALRRARMLNKRYSESPSEDVRARAIDELREQAARLEKLADEGFDLAETWGLIGSMRRRIAYIAAKDGVPDDEALREAQEAYEQGLRADLNSHYCGINALHLSWLTGQEPKITQLTAIVDYAIDAARRNDSDDYWIDASAGEAAVYRGDKDAAAGHYRDFKAANDKAVDDAQLRREHLYAAKRQMDQLVAGLGRRRLDGDWAEQVIEAARAVINYLDGAIART